MGNTMRYVFGDCLEEIKKIKNRADGRYYLEKNATVYYKDKGECENPVAVAAKVIYGTMTALESYISKLIEADAGRIAWNEEDELEKVEEMIRRLQK